MKKMTHNDLLSLSHGDSVVKVSGIRHRGLKYVGRMPGADDRYLIFCDGEHTEHLYISKDGTFYHDWYSGEYDREFLGKLLIQAHQKKIEAIKHIYFD